MKKIILLLLLCNFLNAQDKRFTLSLYTEFPDKNTHNEKFDYALNGGMQIEYQMSIVYFDAEIYHVADLNGMSYTHLQGTVLGFNGHSRFDEWRFYVGAIKLGMIFRDRYIYPMFGSDVGLEYYFNDFYIGLQFGQDFCTDDKLWNTDAEGFWRYNAGLRLGIEL